VENDVFRHWGGFLDFVNVYLNGLPCDYRLNIDASPQFLTRKDKHLTITYTPVPDEA